MRANFVPSCLCVTQSSGFAGLAPASLGRYGAAMQMTPTQQRNAQRLYAMPFAKLYPALLAKVERKGRSRGELEQVVEWLTGYDAKAFAQALADQRSTEEFFAAAPAMNPARSQITGTICGVRLEEIDDPVMLQIRQLDKLVDELAQGKAMEKVLRG